MRSLSIKLVLAFVLTSLAGVVLAAVFIRQFVTNAFDEYVVTQRREAFIAAASAHYAAHGSWAGIDLAAASEWGRPFRMLVRPDGVVEPRPGTPDRRGFVLADADRVVILPADAYRLGARLSLDEYRRGAPITIDGAVVGVVITPRRPAFRNPAEQLYLARTDWALIAAGAAVVGIALVLGILLARVITRPLRDLTAAARAISGGDLQQRVAVRSRDELGVLAGQFNQMSDELAHANQLRRQMTADIAHDLRTPLTVIAGYLESLRDEVLKPTPARFAMMHTETQVLLRLVEDLHTLSLADAGELALNRQPVTPDQLIARAASAYQHAAEQHGVELAIRSDPGAPSINVDSEQISRVLGNLVNNALRYTPSGGRVTLAARAGLNAAELVVADTGAGIARDHLPNIFERFYRTDPSRQQQSGGSGLGLAIVKSIVEAHGGSVRVESAPDQGATFTIVLPA